MSLHRPMPIRPFRSSDIPAVAGLLRQLGTEVAAAELDARIEHVLAQADHCIAVAEEEGELIGLLHVFERPALEKPCEAVVQALVVDGKARGRGIGRALMEFAEAWARTRSLGSVALSTQRAQDFYLQLGYRKVATSDLMRKAMQGVA
jgi:ribosomal protein S18 acetylase RimI-like enzyme